VTDDTRDDDLFEDLDKFFAPIKEVDWDEPAESGAQHVPSEEHVSVHAKDPVPTPVAAGISAPPAPAIETEPAESDDDREAWYETGVMDTIEDPHDPEPRSGAVQTSLEDDENEEEIVRIVDAQPVVSSDDDEPPTTTGEWSIIEDVRYEPPASSEDEEPETSGAADRPVLDDGPSDEEMAAATARFAGSVTESKVTPFEDDDDDVDQDVSVPAGVFLGEGKADDEEEETVSVEEAMATFGGDEARPAMEGYGGPSWQEPATMEVTPDVVRRGPNKDERDVPAAFITGVVLALLALGLLAIGKGAFAVLATIVVVWAQGEFYGAMIKRRHQPATAVGLVSGALMMAGAYLYGEAALISMFALGVVATFLWFMAVPAAHRKNVVANIGLTLLNMAWIPLLGGYLMITLASSDGIALVVAVIGLTFIFDTTAFLAGSVFGGQWFHRGLAPDTSPKKSVEGLLMATAVVALAGTALVPAFVNSFDGKRLDALLLALVIAVAATFGDLAESLLKRDLGVKDMGSILPGHGGLLDRIDSLLFVAPATFLLFRVLFG
jgi:phosphatidate cytidylyltransferase